MGRRVVGALAQIGLASLLAGCAGAAAVAGTPASGAVADEPPVRERRAQRHRTTQAEEEDAPTVELVLRQLSSHHIVVPMSVGEHESLTFILDTGASTSVITRETQTRLGLHDENGTPVKGQGANGELTDVRLFSLPATRVGPREYRDLGVAVMDLAHLQDKLDVPIAGILGRNFLQRHDVEIDFAGGALRLHAVGSIESGRVDVGEMAVTEYGRLAGGLIRIDVSIDGSDRLPAVLDLGAARSVINWNAAKALGLAPDSRQLRKGAEPLLGADNTPIETMVRRFDAIALGDTRIEAPTLHIADLGVFRTLGIGDGPAMVFGLDLLVGRTMMIDYRHHHVYLSKGAS